MSTELLQALCAIASLVVPLWIAWLMLGRDTEPKHRDRGHHPAAIGRVKR